jgi:hypothetical protein
MRDRPTVGRHDPHSVRSRFLVFVPILQPSATIIVEPVLCGLNHVYSRAA